MIGIAVYVRIPAIEPATSSKNGEILTPHKLAAAKIADVFGRIELVFFSVVFYVVGTFAVLSKLL